MSDLTQQTVMSKGPKPRGADGAFVLGSIAEAIEETMELIALCDYTIHELRIRRAKFVAQNARLTELGERAA